MEHVFKGLKMPTDTGHKKQAKSQMSSQVSNENSLKSLWHLNKRDARSSNCKVNSVVASSNNQVEPRECKETEEWCSLLSKGQSIYRISCSRTKLGLSLTVSNNKRCWAISFSSYSRLRWELPCKVLPLICLDMFSPCQRMIWNNYYTFRPNTLSIKNSCSSLSAITETFKPMLMIISK